MDSALRTVGENPFLLLAIGVAVAFLWTLITGLIRTARRRQAFRKYIRDGGQIFSPIVVPVAPEITDEREQQPEEPMNLRTVRAAMHRELELERMISFRANFWLNLLTNFITNLVFFILGVVVTLLTTRPR